MLDSKYTEVDQSTARGYDIRAQLIVPGFPQIDGITIVNRYNQAADIKSMVSNFQIIEDLYSPILKCVLTIRDGYNFFEYFQIDGSEYIILNLTISLTNKLKSNLNLIFKINKFTRFEKTKDVVNVQEYDIECVNIITYASQLSKICKGVLNDPYEEIKSIFKQLTKNQTTLISKLNKNDPSGDLMLSEKNIYNNITQELQTLSDNRFFNITRLQGNITKRSPLAAIEFLRTKCLDNNFAPFFIYNKISKNADDTAAAENIFISSLSDLTDDLINPVYYPKMESTGAATNLPYMYSGGMTNDETTVGARPGSAKYLDKQILKIISLNTILGKNNLKCAAAGGYGNTINVIDYLRRDMIAKQMNPGINNSNNSTILEDFKPLNSEDFNDGIYPFNTIKYNGLNITPSTPENFTNGNDNIIQLFNQSVNSLHLPSSQTENPQDSGLAINSPAGDNIHSAGSSINTYWQTAPEIYAQGLNYLKYYYGKLDNSQFIEISLHGDPHLNPGVKIDISVAISRPLEKFKDDDDQIDYNLSGIYMIITAVHSFASGNYITKIKALKLRESKNKDQRGRMWSDGIDKIEKYSLNKIKILF